MEFYATFDLAKQRRAPSAMASVVNVPSFTKVKQDCDTYSTFTTQYMESGLASMPTTSSSISSSSSSIFLLFIISLVIFTMTNAWPFGRTERRRITALAAAHARATEMQSEKVHVVVLVHGYMGSPLELGYLETCLQKQASSSSIRQDTSFFIHSAACNDGRTSDGIAAGGRRVAAEVNQILQRLDPQKREITLSLVGHSLGGLYARYALQDISLDAVQPKVFCSTATPHLGVSKHTYLPIPRAAEYVVATAMRPTGQDLFRFSPVVQDLAVRPSFTDPLKRFESRLAYVNAFHTDFQVPTATAAFLSGKNEEPNHRVIPKSGLELLRVETVP